MAGRDVVMTYVRGKKYRNDSMIWIFEISRAMRYMDSYFGLIDGFQRE